MATVGIWSVKNNLSRVIDYVSDEKKVDEQTFKDLHNELEYISDDHKTEEKKYVTGINCSTIKLLTLQLSNLPESKIV